MENIRKAHETTDTREKLEADVRKHITDVTSTVIWPPSANKVTEHVRATYEEVIGWLDRQANITARDSGSWRSKYMDLLDERKELEDQLDELQAKVEELELRERCAPDYDFRQAAERWEQAFEDKCAELHLIAEERDEKVLLLETAFKRVKELEAERDKLLKQLQSDTWKQILSDAADCGSPLSDQEIEWLMGRVEKLRKAGA